MNKGPIVDTIIDFFVKEIFRYINRNSKIFYPFHFYPFKVPSMEDNISMRETFTFFIFQLLYN